MKKLISLVLTAILIVSFSLSAYAAGIYGDLTGDKKVNSSDALRVLMNSTGLITFNNEQKMYADVNGNGKVNSSDALLILQYSVRLIDVFPVETGGEPDVDHDFYG